MSRRPNRNKKNRILHRLLFLGMVLSLIGGLAVVYFFVETSPFQTLKTRYPIVHYHGPNQPVTIEFVKKRPSSWVSLNQISKKAVGAVVVSEDWAFYQHNGFDFNQISEAIKKDLKARKFVRGASTITQQVVKNVFLGQEKTLWRKMKELFLALQIEKTLSKPKILEIYFNIAEWGEGVYGIRAASQLYFQKSPDSLSAKEGAFLAMLLPSPKRYNRSFWDKSLTPYARSTIYSILEKMVQAQFISEEEMKLEKETPLSFERSETIEYH